MGVGVGALNLAPTRDYLLLMDASSFAHRAFHAYPRLARHSDGMQTGMLYGFCNTMLKLFWLNYTAIGRLPRYGAVILDVRGKNWRHAIFPDYKAQRQPYDPDLEVQLPWIRTIAEAFKIPCIGLAGYEADDLIASYAIAAERDMVDVVIASSDKDLYQLVHVGDEARCIVYDSMKDKGPDDRDNALVGPHEVYAKFGVMPHQIGDLLALTGDTVDNVPGIKGFGPKTAARLLEQFNDLDGIFEEAMWGDEKFSPKEHAKLIGHRTDVELSRRLVALSEDVPLEIPVEDLWLYPPEARVLRALFMDLEFHSLVEKVDRPAK